MIFFFNRIKGLNINIDGAGEEEKAAGRRFQKRRFPMLQGISGVI
jgi:hypothetical protein